jgi:hypothetical protein
LHTYDAIIFLGGETMKKLIFLIGIFAHVYVLTDENQLSHSLFEKSFLTAGYLVSLGSCSLLASGNRTHNPRVALIVYPFSLALSIHSGYHFWGYVHKENHDHVNMLPAILGAIGLGVSSKTFTKELMKNMRHFRP